MSNACPPVDREADPRPIAMLDLVTDAPPPPADAPEPPRARAALQVAALRGSVAALVALWIVATTRWLQVQPGALFGPGLFVLAAAPLLLICLWRTRMSRAELLGVLAFFTATPLLGLALIDSPAWAFGGLVGVLVAGVVVGALGHVERAGLQRAASLRARGAIALLCGAVASVGCWAAVLQAGFTLSVTSRASLEAGYRTVDGLVGELTGRHLVVGGLIAALFAIVTLVRLCHAGLRAQLGSATCLTPILVAAPVMLWVRPDPLFLGAALIPVWALVLACRGLDALEPGRSAPLALPAGSGQRVLRTVIVALLGLASLHGAVTLFAARRRASALDELARRGVPTRLSDDAPSVDEDGFVLHRRAASAATIESALALLREGAQRPRCRVRGDDANAVRDAVGRVLASRFKERMNRGDVDGAVEVVRLRRAVFARADSPITWREIAMGFDAADMWLVELLALRELSADSCRRLLAALEPPVGDAFVRVSVPEWRIDLVEAHATADEWEPLAGRLPWVRDLALLEALGHVDLVAAAMAKGGLPALQAIDPRLTRRWWPLGSQLRDVRDLTNELVAATNIYETRRRLFATALSLRLHRLATGTYPATLDALVPEHFATVPCGLDGAPFVYTPSWPSGFTLAVTGAGFSPPIVRVYF